MDVSVYVDADVRRGTAAAAKREEEEGSKVVCAQHARTGNKLGESTASIKHVV